MRVLAIRGRNLASLEGEFSIDFTEEPLASAGIFAISGPTGAGKSTLLDAMCLALFSRTPRTELAKENNVRLRDVQEEVLPQSDPRFLLRRGTASGYAEVDFVALNGCRYRARWSVSRAREKESGRLQAARLTLYNIDAGKEEPGTNKDLQARIIELIGLTFDQFTRSVLLAQNDFSTFLKAEQGEKASLLEKLTGTEQYSEISRRIFAKNTEAKEAYEQLYARVQGIELLSEEEVEASQTRLSALEVELARLEKAKVERQSLREAVKAAEVQIASKEKQREENARFLERALASLETSRKEYEQGEVRLARTDEESKSLRLELQQARKLDVQLESALKARSEADERMKDFSRRKQEAEEKLRKVEERQKKASEEWDKQTSWRERYRSKEGIAEQLSALLIHLNTCLTARRAVERSDKALLAIRQKIQRLEVRRQSLRREAEAHAKEQVKIEEERKSVSLALKELEPEALDWSIETCRTERERLLLEQAQFVTTGDIKSLRDKLTAGTPCPVCGSLEHPFASHEAHERLLALADRISEATLRLKRLLDRKERQEACGKQLAALQQKELELHKQLAADENARTELRNQLQSLSEQIDREELDKREGEAVPIPIRRQRPVRERRMADGLEQGPGKLPGDLDGFRPAVASQRGTLAGIGTGAERLSSGTGVVRGFPPSLAQAVRRRRKSLRREESILYPLAFGAESPAGRPARRPGGTYLPRTGGSLEEPFEAAAREYDEARRRGGAIPGDYGTDQEGSGGDFRPSFRTPARTG